MIDALQRGLALKEKIRAGEPTLGLFVRTPAPHVIEVLASSGLDFVGLDAEHAPFDIAALDACIFAARAVGLPALVRVPERAPARILSVLDMGGAGIIAPHVTTASEATEVIAATRYVGGTRGFSGSHRAAGYGVLAPRDYKERSDRAVIVVGQVEDAAAVDNIDELASMDNLDALFIGRADLANSLGVDSTAAVEVERAVDRLCEGARNGGRTMGMFLPSTAEVETFRAKGVSLFIVDTDQALLAKAARSTVQDFKTKCR